MNKKATAFKNYLEEKEITCFEVEEIKDDQLNTVVFRSNITIDGQQLPTVIVLDSSIYSMIRVRIAPSAVNEANEAELTKALMALNRQYKLFKYYLADDGALILDACVLERTDASDGDMIYTVLDVIIKHLTEEYKKLMHLIWG